MRDDSKQIAGDSIVYDDSAQFRAVLDDSPASFIEDDSLIWQAQYYSEKSLNGDKWERGSYYATAQEAIEGAKRGKRTADMFKSLFG